MFRTHAYQVTTALTCHNAEPLHPYQIGRSVLAHIIDDPGRPRYVPAVRNVEVLNSNGFLKLETRVDLGHRDASEEVARGDLRICGGGAPKSRAKGQYRRMIRKWQKAYQLWNLWRRSKI